MLDFSEFPVFFMYYCSVRGLGMSLEIQKRQKMGQTGIEPVTF